MQLYCVTWPVNMMEVMPMPPVKQEILQMVRAIMGIPKVIQAVRGIVVSYVIEIRYLLHNYYTWPCLSLWASGRRSKCLPFGFLYYVIIFRDWWLMCHVLCKKNEFTTTLSKVRNMPTEIHCSSIVFSMHYLRHENPVMLSLSIKRQNSYSDVLIPQKTRDCCP